MKRLATFAALLFVAIGVKVALADGNDPTTLPSATPVYVVASQGSTTCASNAAAAAAQATATINACPAGQFFYITYAESAYSAIAAPAATLMATTSTNIPGSFGWSQPMQAAVGDNIRTASFAVPLKTSTAATATTLVGNAGVASISQNMKLCGFCAK
jgi:hypothetical protein